MNMSILRQTFRFLLIAALLFVTAHRLLAPISVIPESPTPAPEQSPKAKAKRTIKPKASESSESSTKRQTPSPAPKNQATTNRNPFDGTWVGTVDWGSFGNVEHTIVIDTAQKTVNITGCESGSVFRASLGPNGISWTTGLFKEHKWTMKPSEDGKTALVAVYGKSVIFRRTSP